MGAVASAMNKSELMSKGADLSADQRGRDSDRAQLHFKIVHNIRDIHVSSHTLIPTSNSAVVAFSSSCRGGAAE